MICVQNLSRSYLIEGSEFFALQDITASFPLHKISVILGRSGAGKTTLIRLIAGLEAPSFGEVRMPSGFPLKMVFQEPRLMPWLNVEQNIRFWGSSAQSCTALLQKTGLEPFKSLYPSQISGGMAQKTAMARALFAQPKLILMDEPFASLDYFSRRELQKLLLRFQKDEQMGVLFITHNVDEAVLLGDELFILEGGRLKAHLPNSAPNEERENTPYADHLKKQILSLVEI